MSRIEFHYTKIALFLKQLGLELHHLGTDFDGIGLWCVCFHTYEDHFATLALIAEANLTKEVLKS